MKIDSGLLDRRFELMGTREAGQRITGAFGKPDIRYYIVGERWQPGLSALLIERRTLMEDLVREALASESPEWRQLWIETLEHKPELLPGLIAGGVLRQAPHFKLDPGVARRVRLSGSQHRAVREYLQSYLAQVPEIALIDALNASAAELEEPAIAVAEGRVLGVYPGRGDPEESAALRWKPSASGPLVLKLALNESKGAEAKPAPVPNVTSARSALAAEEFSAFPRLTVRSPAVPDGLLPFAVGFSTSADPQAQEQTPIHVKEPQGNLLVIASAEGATIAEPCFVQLPMEMAAEHTFVAHVAKDAAKVLLRVKYFYQNNLVGSIVKPVPLAAQANVGNQADSVGVGAALELARLRLDEIAARVNLVLLVENAAPGFASWTALVPATGQISASFTVKLGDETRFARDLARLRGRYGDRGTSARVELNVTGGQIAALIPEEIRDVYLLPALRGPQPPSILLMTDQAFVPWELARFGPQQLGGKSAAFLGELARVGRWWTATNGSAPRSCRKIEHLSAVAATQYTGARSFAALPHALAERTWLVDTFQKELKVSPVEATLPKIQTWLESEPRPVGHLGHIALHGFADAQEDAQGLVLGDGRVLTPNLLAGEFYAGDIPRFEAIFLNACQVGTAGERLGRISGFPGALLGAGAAALIAPLWEVEDSVACLVAQEFYRLVLVERNEVAEVMRQLRLQIDRLSITPVAYIYYGHPCLQLTH